ncbi:hypothetical protein EIN_085070 [Entamoeba invadens IP1]|uniref:hypothetical protein n=1 Tax=Entamoeba invadens IP1 TaxID=370355 RepID=UPI0002C3F32A|nr:hypothetical protein EIN_085070 [Entamoeba invadens IP1]ELP85295.1 hypothetical protein EIN_085070 [Entamoeba invadens IP1]|eukprot:XP_004184641.1 hypothetical protein EIN_085070 [Entamoeba invadens IP1]
MDTASVDHALKNSRIKIHSFSIWGIPPTTIVSKNKTVKPELLYKYPDNANLPSHLVEFIIPFECKTEAITNANLMRKESPYFQLLHTNTHSLFCTCLPHVEVVPFPSDIIQESEIRKLYTMTTSTVLTRRVYCLATSAPIMTTSARILNQLLQADFEYKTKWLEMFYLKTMPIEKSFVYKTSQKEAIERVKNVIDQFNEQLRDQEREFIGEVSQFSRSPSPMSASPLLAADDMLKKNFSFHSVKFNFSSQLKSIRRFCYPRLLTTVNPVAFLQMINAVMSGIGCVCISPSEHQLSIACFALLAMLDPFSWQGLFIPIVPPQLSDFLESPMPAILGSLPPNKKYVLATADVVYLEKQPMFKKVKSNPKVITIPKYELLVLKIASLVQEKLGNVASGKTFEDREVLLSRVEDRVIDEFVEEIHALVKASCIDEPLEMVKKAMDTFKPKTINDFLERFISLYKDNKYVCELVQTQHFNSWWYDNYDKESSKS